VCEDIVLLLTGTIKVGDKKLAKRNDERQRLNDYKLALRKWIESQSAIKNIVFVENSGYPLNELEEIAKDNEHGICVDFISFNQNGRYHGKGKSYGEICLIEYAHEHSRALKKCKYFIKVTGRLFVRNFESIVRSLPSEYDFVCNFSNNLAYIDTTIVGFRSEVYIKRIHQYAAKNVCDEEKEYIERVFAKAILMSIACDYRWYPLLPVPIIEGMSGTKNKPYTQGRVRSIKGTILSRLFHDFNRTSYGLNKPHILEIWKKPPTDLHSNSDNAFV